MVESTGFIDRTFLDASGLPHSDEMSTVERIRKVGNQLEDIITIHDPEMYARDWQARFVYDARNDVRLEDYACNDRHRDLSGVKGVQTSLIRRVGAQRRIARCARRETGDTDDERSAAPGAALLLAGAIVLGVLCALGRVASRSARGRAGDGGAAEPRSFRARRRLGRVRRAARRPITRLRACSTISPVRRPGSAR